MLSSTQLSVPTGSRVEFGVGALQRLPDSVAAVGKTRAFVVTDPGVRAAGLLDRMLAVLTSAGVEYDVYADVAPNPSTGNIDAAAAQVRAFGDAVIIALGGGSALDAAKGIALLAVNSGVAQDYDYRHTPENDGLPIIAVPTTAGTGAETNGFGVIEDSVARCKVYIGHGSVQPKISLLDPELTVGLPPRATAATGMDALIHGIESLASREANPLSAAYATQAIGMVSRWLPAAVRDGSDLEARSQMILAAHLAGLALSISGLGLVHGIAHSVTAHTGAVHGLALSSVLCDVMEFSVHEAEPAFCTAALAMGASADKDNESVRARSAIRHCRDLAHEVGTDLRLAGLGCTPDMLDSVAAGAVADIVTANAPRLPTIKDVRNILDRAL